MKKTRRFLALALALVLCVSLCSCGGKAEETTEPTTNEDRLAGIIFAEELMQGLEHYGLSINADQASDEQMLMATAMLNLYDHQLMDGTEHLYSVAAYYYMALSDGNWYVPASFVLPSDAEGDNLHLNHMDYISADWGRLTYGTQFVTLKLTEEEQAAYAQTDGWEEMSKEQIYMFALLQEFLDQIGLTVESDNLVNQMDESTVFNYSIRPGEEGDVMTIINLHFYQACADGSLVIACTTIDGIPVKMEEEQITFDMTEDEKDAFHEFMNYTGFYSWLEIIE